MPYKDKAKQKEAQRRYYLKGKQKYKERLKQARIRNKKYVYEHKTECCYCGLTDKVCLDFDHQHDKIKNVSQLIRDGVSLQKLQAEIDKCNVVCGNCHAKRHRPIHVLDGETWNNYENFRIKKRQWYNKYLDTQECIECGENHNSCLEFHHIGKKRYTISYLIGSGHSLEYLQEEIKVCQVLCVNCHRKQHQKGV